MHLLAQAALGADEDNYESAFHESVRLKSKLIRQLSYERPVLSKGAPSFRP